MDAWCAKCGIEHPTTLEDVLRRTARGPFCVGDQRGGRSGDEALCEQFGTTLEEVEVDVERYERGDFAEFAFADSVDGKPEGLVDSILEEAEE